jgi:hypothetical protein
MIRLTVNRSACLGVEPKKTFSNENPICWPSSVQSFSAVRYAALVAILYCLRLDTSPTWRARSRWNRVVRLYPRHWVPVASYDSQGYSGCIRTRIKAAFKDWVRVRVRVIVRVTLQLTVSQSVCLGVEPNLGLLTREFFFVWKLQSCYLGRPLWQEVGSVICQTFVFIVCSRLSN